MTYKDNLGYGNEYTVMLEHNDTSVCIANNYSLDYESICIVYNMLNTLWMDECDHLVFDERHENWFDILLRNICSKSFISVRSLTPKVVFIVES